MKTLGLTLLIGLLCIPSISGQELLQIQFDTESKDESLCDFAFPNPETSMNDKSDSKRMHRIINTWIDIDAKPEEIWEVLMDFKTWESWNPFIPLVEGNLQIGEHMRIKVTPPGMKPVIFKPEVYEVRTNEKILWGGSFLRVLYRGDHAFILEPISDGKTRFRQIERFMGPMVLLMGSMIKKTEIGYDQMNLALKKQVERSK